MSPRPGVGEVVGLDPSPVFVEHARGSPRACQPLLRRRQRDRAAFDDGAFDAVVFHTCSRTSPTPAGAGRGGAGHRRGGALAVFDGDYATTTVAVGDHDPLQACADAAMARCARSLPRAPPRHARAAAGWEVVGCAATATSRRDPATCSRSSTAARTRWWRPALGGRRRGAEGRGAPRVAAGEFFGHIAYASLIARVRP